MAEGFNVDLQTFESMNTKNQNKAIFQNTQQIIEWTSVHEQKDNKRFTKIYIALGVLAVVGFGIRGWELLLHYLL